MSLCAQELYHPRDFLSILAAIPVCRNDTGLTVLDRGLRFLFCLGFLVGLVNSSSTVVPEEHKSHRACLSTCVLDTVTGQESIPHRSHRACLVTLSLDTVEDVMVGEVDELEEDVG